MDILEQKQKTLKSLIGAYKGKDLVVAFSGGVDSSLILKLACLQAKQEKTKVYAAIVHTMLQPKKETELAEKLAEKEGAVPVILAIDELNEAGIRNNPKNRCYLCKKYMFSVILKEARKYRAAAVLEGTNADDLNEYRPGIAALSELGIESPLVQSGFTKAEVRTMASALGIETAEKPSAPCMATRFPYDTELSYREIERAVRMEEALRQQGYVNVRARIHGDIVRIEVDREEIPRAAANAEQITEEAKKLGYRYVTLDLEGFRSGSFDR